MKLRLKVGKAKGTIVEFPLHHARRLLETNMAEELSPEELEDAQKLKPLVEKAVQFKPRKRSKARLKPRKRMKAND